MTEYRLRSLMSSEVITDRLPEIIEAFVSYYGEDRREEITNRLRSLIILKFSNIETLERNIDAVISSLFKEVYGIADNEYVPINADVLIKYLKSDNPDEYIYISDKVKEIITGNKETRNEEIYDNFKKGLYPKLEEFIRRFQTIKERIIPYEEELKRNKEMVDSLKTKYYDILIEEFKDLFTQEEIEKYKSTKYPTNTMIRLFGFSITASGNCFDDHHDELLNNPNSPEWQRESIEKDRKKLLEAFNIDLDKLSDQEKRETISIIRVICEKVSKREEELYTQMSNEIVLKLDDYKRNRAILDSIGLVNKNDALGSVVYNSGISCVEENFIMGENGLELHPLVLINSTASDVVLIHELNHAFETHILGIEGNEFVSISGWDSCSGEIKSVKDPEQEPYKGISRDHELLSEYVNDRLAEEITKIMHEQGCFIFGTASKSSSYYKTVSFFVEPFFQSFKDIIIASRSNGNFALIYEELGQDNFEALNDLVNDFYKECGYGFGAAEHIYNFIHNNADSKTEILSEMKERQREILDRMKEHYQSKHMSM